jgi:thiosulfate/3-mercaptopyruvate sulfurtransferase
MNDIDFFTVWLQANNFQPDQPLNANPQGEYALILAARQGRDDILDHLFALQSDLTVIDQYGNNALWAACFAEASPCISLLLAAGINIDFQNPSGATALIYSSSSGKTAVVEQLLQAGANPHLITLDEFSALDLAANRQCLNLLRTATNSAA